MSALGQKQTLQSVRPMSRFTPESGHRLSVPGCPLCANSGHRWAGVVRFFPETGHRLEKQECPLVPTPDMSKLPVDAQATLLTPIRQAIHAASG